MPTSADFSAKALTTHSLPEEPSAAGHFTKPVIRQYGIAILALLAALLLRSALTPWLQTRVPFITLFPAVAVAVWYGGYGPAIVAMILGYIACDYFFIEPFGTISIGAARLVAFSAYLLSCSIIIAFGEGMRRSKRRLQASENGLRRQVKALTKLHELSMRLAVTEELNPALGAILKTLVDIHCAQYGLLSLSDPDSGYLREAASVGIDIEGREKLGKIMPGPDVGACGKAFVTRKRAIVFDVETDPSFIGYREAARAVGFRAVHSTPILTRSGEILGVLSVHFALPRQPDELEIRFADMCARHAAETIESRRSKQALHESEQKLRRQATELEEQLIASGRLVSIGEITASLAHEFNNPLGILMGFAQELMSEKTASDPDYRPLKIIYEEGKRCQKIVADLFEFSRPQKTDLQEIRVERLVKKTLALVSARLHKQKIKATVESHPDVPSITADPVQVEQVLVNLYLNAIDAMPDGGILKIQVARADTSDDRSGERVRIVVTDTGAGIDEQSLSRIFQPFFTEKKRTGLGLGLSICHRIVQNHGGKINVASALGKGTTFTIYLPVNGLSSTSSISPVAPPRNLLH